MTSAWGNRIDGRQLLRTVKQSLARFKPSLSSQNTRVAIIHFEAPSTAPQSLTTRIEAAKVSTRAKLKTFRDLGVEPVDLTKLWDISTGDFVATISQLNQDPTVAGIIVQHPMPPDFQVHLKQIAPDKDLDALTIRESGLFQVPATSEAIWRTVEPYTDDNPLIAVVGARGFVGRGVITKLREHGLSVLSIDARDPNYQPDNLLDVARADIVISTTGQPEILDRRHLRPHHRLVVDCGFSPMGDEIYGDVKKSAYDIPQNITPVPGGIGPTEMAILAERLVQKSVAPELEPWSSPRNEYLSRERVANLQSHWAQNIYPIARRLLSTFSPSSQVSGERYRVSFDSDSGYLSIDSLDERGTIVEYDNRGRNGVALEYS